MKSKQFQVVVEHAHRVEEQAARALGEANQRVEAAQEQLNRLRLYRQEYLQRYQELGGQGHLEPGRLRDYQAFLAKLNDAIDQQQKVLDEALDQQDKVRLFWLEKRGRSKALDNVLVRYIEQEQRQQDRREQREIDDRFCALR